MATFALKNFGHKGYASLRPSYPKGLYDLILSYHRGARNTAIDLGCGHGVVTRAMASQFSNVVGIDPAEGMLEQARELTPSSQYPGISYRHGGAEDLAFAADASVDAVVSGQAVHWFNQAKLWPELARVMRPGATVAFWCYEVPMFPGYPAANKITENYGYGPALGAYWPGNGATIIRDKLSAIKPPAEYFVDIERATRDPGQPLVLEDGSKSYIVRKELSLADVGRYWRTQSAYFLWKEAHPDRVSRDEGGSGDVIDDYMDELKQVSTDLQDMDRIIPIEFATMLIMARRK